MKIRLILCSYIDLQLCFYVVYHLCEQKTKLKLISWVEMVNKGIFAFHELFQFRLWVFEIYCYSLSINNKTIITYVNTYLMFKTYKIKFQQQTFVSQSFYIQISSLISDNRELVRRLDNLKKLTKDGTRSSVEQEVREIQNIR